MDKRALSFGKDCQYFSLRGSRAGSTLRPSVDLNLDLAMIKHALLYVRLLHPAPGGRSPLAVRVSAPCAAASFMGF